MQNAYSGARFIFSLSYLPITAGFSLIMWLRKCSLKNLTVTNEQLQELYSCVTSVAGTTLD